MIWLLGIILPFLFLLIIYLLGPKPEAPTYDLDLPELPRHLFEIAEKIEARESALDNIRPDNEARIIWSDVQAEKTEYAVVYLHGFSASMGDGNPVHREFAEYFSCNLYLPRLHAHGLANEEPLLDFRQEEFLKSAVEALAVGKRIGKKVILMGTSTGASLALYLAAHFPDIHGLLLLSPNVELFDKKTWLLSKPWGLQIARMVLRDKYRRSETKEEKQSPYWDNTYRLEAAVQLKSMIEHTMSNSVFHAVEQPCWVGYYYKNEEEQDKTVSVPHILSMYKSLGTDPEWKRIRNFPDAGDHCIASSIWSASWEEVRDECIRFAEEILGMEREK